jgi:HlyD family secretion protein
MSCRAEVFTQAADGAKSLAVAVQSVKYEEASNKEEKPKTSVFVVVDGKAVKRTVETGAADDEYIEIVKGLSTDEEVVVGPSKTLNFLRDGERVAAKPALAKESQAAGDSKKDGGIQVSIN